MKKLLHKITNLLLKAKTSVLVIVFLVMFVGVNVLMSKTALRVDFSTNKAYSLSPSSKKILQNLKKDAELVLFVSDNLPPQARSARQDAMDLLGEFVRSSGNRVKLTVLDPLKDPKAAERAKKLQVEELQFRSISNNNFQVVASYYGLSLVVGDKHELIPGLISPETLEFDISSALYKLTAEKPVKVGILGGTKFSQSGDAYSLLKNALTKLYEIQPLTPGKDGIDFLSSSAVVVLADSQTILDENSVKSLKKYIEQGGNALLYVDGVNVQSGSGVVVQQPNLDNLLRELGVKVDKSLVAVSEGEIVQYGTGGQILLAKYPFWFNTNNFSPNSSALVGISSLGFAWTSPVDVESSSSAKPVALIKTQANAGRYSQVAALDPAALPANLGGKDTLTLVSESSLGQGKAVVWGNTRSLEDESLQRSPGNFAFLYNMLSNYTSGGALSGIAARNVSNIPVRPIAQNYKEPFKWTIILLSPMLLGLFGFLILRKRSKG